MMARTRKARVPWVLATLCILLLLAWARQIQAAYLIAATLSLGGAAAAARRARAPALLWAALVTAALGVVTGLDAERRFRAIEHDWTELIDERDEQLGR
ncbi:MAG: hypothetical protein ACREKM_08605, partial [Longimicrobiales bacterium]